MLTRRQTMPAAKGVFTATVVHRGGQTVEHFAHPTPPL